MDDLTEEQIAENRRRSLAYAERIEYLWEHDPVVRERIELGLRQLAAGEVVPVDIDDLLRRQGHSDT